MSHEILTRHFFDGDTLHGQSRLIVEDSVLVSIEPTSDASNFYLVTPGLVDIQMNGFGEHDVSAADSESIKALDVELARAGTTSWCATVVTSPLQQLSDVLWRLHEIWLSSDVQGFLGVHLEGPFLGGVPGAHRPEWIIPFDFEWLTQLMPSVRLMTVGAEQEFITEASALLKDRGIAISIGHSSPTTQQFNDAVGAGASMVTHLYNGMSGVHHRDAGLALLALTDPRVTVGLIGDLVHVSPEAISLAYQAKGVRGVCLVSDSIAWASQRAKTRGIEVKGGAARLPNGTLAGSCTPLAECLARVVLQCGVNLVDALRSATSVPADLVGANGIGRAQTGNVVDLVAFDDSLHVVNTWRRLPSVRA